MIVHLLDGTYELFRHYHGGRRARGEVRSPADGAGYQAVRGVLRMVLSMIESGATHVGVATDHVIESFRNRMWPGYKTSAGVDRALLAQFGPLEEALVAMGVQVWPMVDMEADDALASAAFLAAAEVEVDKVCIWTPDKDLAQCVRGDRVVQVNVRTGRVADEDAVLRKFGVQPAQIPDLLALAGDAADGYPGISGIGRVTAARLINQYGSIEVMPPAALSEGHRELAMLFKDLATLRTNLPLFKRVDELAWHGPGEEFQVWEERLGDPVLLHRARALAAPRRTV